MDLVDAEPGSYSWRMACSCEAVTAKVRTDSPARESKPENFSQVLSINASTSPK